MVKLLGRSVVLLAGLLLYGFMGTSEAQLVLYDAFPGPLIDPTKWFGRSDGDVVEAPNLETQRGINNHKLVMAMTTYGGTDADFDASGLGRQRLRISDPTGITTIQAEVAVVSAITQGCPANPTPTVSSVQLVGTFFNDGTVGGSGRNGDIAATFGKFKSSIDGNRIEAFVHRCDGACFAPSGVVASHVFATKWTNGANHTLRMEWDAANNLFRFTVNPGKPSQEVATIPYAFSDTTPQRGPDFKELRVENVVADCTTGQKRGSITGRYDDVMLNP